MHLSTLWKTQFVSIYYFLGVDISGHFGVLPEIFLKNDSWRSKQFGNFPKNVENVKMRVTKGKPTSVIP